MGWLSMVGSGGSLVVSSSCGVVRSLVMSLGAVVRDRVGDVVGLIWVLSLLRLLLQLQVVRVLHFAHWSMFLLDVMRDVGLLNFVRLGSLMFLRE